MFEKKNQPNLEPILGESANEGTDIFVMPDLGASKKSKGPLGGRKKLPLPAILGIVGGVVIIGFGAFAYFVLQPSKKLIVSNKQPSEEARKEESAPPPTVIDTESPPQEISTTTPVEPPKAEEPKVLSFGPDDDSDGLTNEEEKLIYKSDPFRPDTDNDGFLDGNEVFHLYSPIGATPVALLGSGLALEYQNTEFGYKFFHPRDWTIKKIEKDSERELLLETTSGETFSLTVSDNVNNLSLFDWYVREVPGGDLNSLEPIVVKGGFSALQSSNRLTTYLALSGKVLVISMNIGTKTQIEYRRTYEMILNSLTVK